MCDCKSYNKPEWGGVDPEVEIDPSVYFSDEEKKVLVDPCMVPIIRRLWSLGIWTLGCCCGHNQMSPSIVVALPDCVPQTAKVIEQFDGRAMQIIVWTESVNLTGIETARKTHSKPKKGYLWNPLDPFGVGQS